MTDYIPILSHMRSRSSLLTHLLGSNDEIPGYSELHLSYRRPLDVVRMRIRLALSTRRVPRARYLLGKVLHNSHPESDRVLNDERIRPIFLVREPECTLQSLIQMARETGVDYYSNPSNALVCYCERLAWLSACSSQNLEGRAVYIDSDDLVARSRELLGALTRWLDLSEPLTRHYCAFSRTGAFGAGDPPPNIRTGRIVRPEPAREIQLPRELLATATRAYRYCLRALRPLRGNRLMLCCRAVESADVTP